MKKIRRLIRLRRIRSARSRVESAMCGSSKTKSIIFTGWDELLFSLSWHRNPDQNIVNRHSMSERLTAADLPSESTGLPRPTKVKTGTEIGLYAQRIGSRETAEIRAYNPIRLEGSSSFHRSYGGLQLHRR